MRRMLFVIFATAVALVGATAASAGGIDPPTDPVPNQWRPDLVISSWSADSFTVTNLPCACGPGPGTATATKFWVTVESAWFSTADPLGWVRSSTRHGVISLPPGASVGFPYSLAGRCGWVRMRVDSENDERERDESNNVLRLSLPQEWICQILG